ncbi:MAG: hypothetical protein ACRDJL_00740 [Actinomycetota bacterium]
MNELERSLFALGERVEWPEGADLTRPVRTAIEARPPRRSAPGRALAFAAAVVVLAAFVSLLVSPGTRTAVADFLGLGGVRIDTQGPVPTPAEELDLGRRLSLAEANESVEFEVRVPTALGEPDQVFLDTGVPGGQVALAYEATGELPAAPGTNLGALLTQFPDAEVAETALKKVTGSDPGTAFEPVIVDNRRGFWISGEPHLIAYLESDGGIREDTVRLAGNVLLWEAEGVTYRLESTLARNDALAIAESLD